MFFVISRDQNQSYRIMLPPNSRELPASSEEYLTGLENILEDAYRKGMSDQFKLQVIS